LYFRFGAGERGGRRLRFTPRVRLVLLLAVLVAGLLFGAWLWLRDSSFVAVDQVTISGESGADAAAIRGALRSAARNMTTLDVQMNQLQTAVAPFPEVKRLRVRTVFPHRMVIEVVEERPVGVVEVAGRGVPVAGDGTLLRSVSVGAGLPVIPLSVAPVGRRLTDERSERAVALLAAAPYSLLSRISQVTTAAGHGLVAELRSGPSLYFGEATNLRAKWAAAIAVLADPGSAGASYIDVTDPSRPAAGAGSAASTTATTSPSGVTSAVSGASGSGGTAASSAGAITGAGTPATASGPNSRTTVTGG
jgi:cell division protein FtsQ